MGLVFFLEEVYRKGRDVTGGALWLSSWEGYMKTCPANHLAVSASVPVVGDGTWFLLPCTEAVMGLVMSKSSQYFSTFSTLYSKS